MERITYVLLNSATENRVGFLSFVNQLLPCSERHSPQYEPALGVPLAGTADMGMLVAEKEGRTGFSSGCALGQGGRRICLKIAVDSRINGQGMAHESR
jgi:hypothetical protein